jgi:nucleoside-diphosphate-sugar epimerase
MTPIKKTALVAGATGVVGRNLLRRLVSDPDWDVIAVSRRKPDVEGEYRHIAADLLDPADAEARLGGRSEVTHIFFSAYIEKPTWAAMVAPNMALLISLMDALEPAAEALQHVNLMHGTKWYGNHLGPFKTPAKETDPGHMPPNSNRHSSWTVRRARRGHGPPLGRMPSAASPSATQ